MSRYSDYYDFEDIMSDMDDRDDRDDRPTQSYYDGDHCEHGQYVGGCGIDWMCSWCEMGVSAKEAREIITQRQTSDIRRKAEQAAKLLNDLLKIPECGGIFAAEMTERSSNVNNPESRYGRTGWDMGR